MGSSLPGLAVGLMGRLGLVGRGWSSAVIDGGIVGERGWGQVSATIAR